MSDPQETAPAQSVEVETPVSAVDAAVSSQDVSAFRAARSAERHGTPLAPAPAVVPPAAESAAPAPTQEERKISKRQEQINEYERQLAELKAENARLKTPAPAPVAPAPPKADVPTETFAFETYEQWTAKAGNGERAYEDYITDRAVARVKFENRLEAETQRKAQAETRQRAESQRIQQAWSTKVASARERHADFDAVALQAPTEIQPGTTLDYWILESPDGAEVLYHLQQHPAEIRRIAALSPISQARELVALEAKLAAPQPKHVSDAPAPPVTLGTHAADLADALDTAVTRGDVAAFRAEKLARLRASQR